MASKRFDKELYDKYDSKAKYKVMSELTGTDFTLVVPAKRTDVDLKVMRNGKHIANIECEVKTCWKGSKFPFATVQFPERKGKYCKLSNPTYFVMFNEDLTNYLVVTGEDLLNSQLRMVPNKFVKYGENFYKVDLHKIHFNNLKDVMSELTE